MNRPLRFLVAAAILGATVPRVATADPVTITSGSISVPASFSVGSPIQLQGTDGVLPFFFTGFISPDSSIEVRGCRPCGPTATMINLGIASSGGDLAGMVTYGDDQYRVGGNDDTVGNVFLLISGSALLPAPPSVPNQLATITGPFAIERGSFQPPIRGGPFGPGNTLLGSGLTTRPMGCRAGASSRPSTGSATRHQLRNLRRSCCWRRGWRDLRCSAAGGGSQLPLQ